MWGFFLLSSRLFIVCRVPVNFVIWRIIPVELSRIVDALIVLFSLDMFSRCLDVRVFVNVWTLICFTKCACWLILFNQTDFWHVKTTSFWRACLSNHQQFCLYIYYRSHYFRRSLSDLTHTHKEQKSNKQTKWNKTIHNKRFSIEIYVSTSICVCVCVWFV